MNIECKEAIVDELTRLVNGGKTEERGAGICWQIQHVVANTCDGGTYCDLYYEWQELMVATCKEWDKWTGSEIYPVPYSAECCNIDAAREAFGDADDMFDHTTEYGANRLELAQLLLDAVTDLEVSNDTIHTGSY